MKWILVIHLISSPTVVYFDSLAACEHGAARMQDVFTTTRVPLWTCIPSQLLEDMK